ncbi:MAG TPA: hypothetical protein VL357_07285 [Rariglobus sp.]|jgi:hypothetical protein|nr:hypothetical protein [Rariglobus sp.]
MHLRRLAFVAALLVVTLDARAWDYNGHRIVNQLALAGLPDDFPAFVKTPEAAARIAFLAGEPDRWRNISDLPLRHENSPDHYLDMEGLDDAGIPLDKLSEFRYVFVAQLSAARATHPEKFAAINSDKNKDHVRELIGFLPWAITENYGKLKSAFSYLKAYEQYGTPDEIANARANAIYIMGVMGHYVGDGAQPLHTTKHTNGWVGSNPHHYTTWTRFHGWIDGGYIAQIKLTEADLEPRAKPARVLETPASPPPTERDPVFTDVLAYLAASHARVELLYRLDQTGALKPDAPDSVTAPGRVFIGEQLLRGGEMLSSLWLTAYRRATPDTYLRAQLLKRQSETATPDT